jgi:DNA-binding MarR family transcriptional regulator
MSMRDNIGYLLQHTASSLARQADQTLQDQLSIGYSQFKIMMVLEWNPHLRQRDIANRLGQTEASISRQIKLMHEDGLLQTTIIPSNKREHITTLTSKGAKCADKAKQVLNRYYAPMLERLNEQERQQFMHTLNVLHDEVCKSGRAGGCS